MKIEDIINVLTLTVILGMFANGLSAIINPVMWYDFVYAIAFFFLTSIGIYGYQKMQASSETKASK